REDGTMGLAGLLGGSGAMHRPRRGDPSPALTGPRGSAPAGRSVVTLVGGRTGRAEHPQQPEHAVGRVLQAVRDPGRQEDAGARTDRLATTVGVDEPFAPEDEDGLLVRVGVVGGAAAFDEPDELGDVPAAEPGVDQELEGAVVAGGEVVLVALVGRRRTGRPRPPR